MRHTISVLVENKFGVLTRVAGLFSGRGYNIDSELVLVKVAVDSRTRAEVMQITDIFRAKIVDVQPKSLAIEVTGNESKVQKLLDLMNAFGVIDWTRTGKVALPRN